MQDKSDEEKVKAALGFMQSQRLGVVATLSAENKTQASFVYFACNEDFSIYFSTLSTSRKYAAIKKNPRVAFTVAKEDVPQTLQIEGIAHEVIDEKEVAKATSLLIPVITTNKLYFPPVTKLSDGEIVTIVIKPDWIRWGDFTSEAEKYGEIFVQIPIR